MAQPKALVLRAAGTNCDREAEHALQLAGFAAERVHVFRLMESPQRLAEFQFLLVPGGFSYGDDVAAGKILANQMLRRLAEPLNEFLAAGKLVLGICNGFQVLLKSGLLPGGRVRAETANCDVTLSWNDSARFECRWVHLKAEDSPCVFCTPGEMLALPVAHGEGKFICRDDSVLRSLQAGGQVVLRYCNAAGEPGGYPINPNGSVDDIAGICDATGRVMGLMPHPERFVDPTQHPQWTRRSVARPDGLSLFQRAFAYLNQN